MFVDLLIDGWINMSGMLLVYIVKPERYETNILNYLPKREELG
jgi:hypothetical protein